MLAAQICSVCLYRSNTCLNNKKISGDLTTRLYPRFNVRYKNIKRDGTLHKAGIRNGQFGVVVKHPNGMFSRIKVGTSLSFIKTESNEYYLADNQICRQ